MQITESVLNVAVDASAQRYGGDISALGITLAVSLSMVIWMPSTGINQGAQALLSYNYGSGNYDRAMETGKALCYQGFFTKTMNIGARIMPKAVTRYFVHKMNQ